MKDVIQFVTSVVNEQTVESQADVQPKHQGGKRPGGETSGSEQKGVMQ